MKLPHVFESLGNSSDDIDNFKESNMSSLVDPVNAVSDEVNVTENVNKITENGDIKAPEKCLLTNGLLETDEETSGFHMSVMKSVVKKLLNSVPEHNSEDLQNSLPNEKKDWGEPNTELIDKGNRFDDGIQDEGSSDEESLHLHLTEDEDSVNSSPKKDAPSPASTVNDGESNVMNDCTKDGVDDCKELGKTPETYVNEDCFPSGTFVGQLDLLEHTTSKDESGALGKSSQDTQSTETEAVVCESRHSNMVSETSLDHKDETYLEANEQSSSIEKGKGLDKASSVESCIDKESSRILNIPPVPNRSLLVNSDESTVVDLPMELGDKVLRMDSDLEINQPSSETSAGVGEEKNKLTGGGGVHDELSGADKISDTTLQNSSSNEEDSCRGLGPCNSNESSDSISIFQKSTPAIDSEIPENGSEAFNLLTPNNVLSNVDHVKLKDVLTNSCSNLDKLEENTDLKNAENLGIHKSLDVSKIFEKCETDEQIKDIENLEDHSSVIINESSSKSNQNLCGMYNSTKLTNKENVGTGTKEIEKQSMENKGVKTGLDEDFCSLNPEIKCTILKSSAEENFSKVSGDDEVSNAESKVLDESNTSKECNNADNSNIESSLIDVKETDEKVRDETNIITEQNSVDNFQSESSKAQESRQSETNAEKNIITSLKIESTLLKTNNEPEKECPKATLDVDGDSKMNSISVSVDHSIKETKSELNLIDEKEICSSEEPNEKCGSQKILDHPGSELMQTKKPSDESNLPKNTSNETKLCSTNDASISKSLDVDDLCLSRRLKSNSSEDDDLKLTKTGQQDMSCKRMESTLIVKSVEDLNSSAISVNIFEDKKKSVLDENMSDLGMCGDPSEKKMGSVQSAESKINLEVNKTTTGNHQCATNTAEESSDERTALLKSNVCENQNECELKLSSCDSRNSFTSSDLEMEASDCSSVPSQKAVSQGCAMDLDQDVAESTEQTAAGLAKRTKKRSHPDEDNDTEVKRTRQLVEVETKESDANVLNRSKRMSSDTTLETARSKKVCTDDAKSPTEVVSNDNVPEAGVSPMPFMQYLRTNHLKNLTRSELEEFVVQKVCEALTERSYVGVLRQQLQVQEQLVDVWQKKVQSLQKQVKDMDLVVKRFYNDQRVRKDRSVFPIKITRSVGLQVHMPTARSHLPADQEGIAAQMSKRKSLPSAQSAVLKSPTVGASTSGGSTRGTGVQYQRNVTAGTSVSNLANSQQVIRAGNTTSPAKVGTSLKTISPRLPQVVNNSQSAANNTTVVNSSKYSVPIKPARTQALYAVPNNAQPVPIQPKPAGQVIDLTDEEDRVRSAGLVRNIIPSTSQSTSTVNTVATVGNQGTIRVVPQPQLTSSAAGNSLMTQATAVGSTGRVTYLVPTSNASLQQRQVLLSSTSSQQIVGNNAASVTNAGKSQMQALLLKNGSVVSMAPLVCPTTTQPILRTSVHTQQPQTMSSQRVNTVRTTTVSQVSGRTPSYSKHPAQLPPCPVYNQGNANWKKKPPPPELKLAKQNNKQQGIVLSWNMTVTSEYEAIASYQLYAYQEGSTPPSTSHWKKVGDVKALPLPMACTLTQFVEGHKYHFAVRAVDIHSRVGPFSEPESIVLTRK